MKKMSIPRLVLMAVLAAFLAAGCARKPAPTPTPAEGETPVVTQMPEREVPGIQERELSEEEILERERAARAEREAAMAELQRIFFDFDQYVLTPQARDTLAQNAEYIKANPGVRVRIEGHCDERGSDEYNLALGERRAQAAQKYLVSLGIDPEKLDIISYGEEKPLDPGSGEAAWAKNRRAEFVAVR